MKETVEALASEAQIHRWEVFEVDGMAALVVVGRSTLEARALMSGVGARLCERLALESPMWEQGDVDDGQ